MDPFTTSQSAPVTSTEKLPLSQAQLKAINDMMNNKSKKLAWNILIDRADNDASEWQLFSSNILMVFVDQGLIVTSSLSKADEFVQGFNTKEFEEWKDGVWKGVKGGNWADLLHYHMYLLPWTPDHIQLLQCATSLCLS